MIPLMQFGEEHPRLGRGSHPVRSRLSRFLLRAAAIAVSTLVLIAALAVSIVLFAVILTIVAVLGAYVWWKTRALREQIRSATQGGRIIEGEVVREAQPEESPEHRTRTK
jgi:membrane protein implicated in regulation of membrane protease activity